MIFIVVYFVVTIETVKPPKLPSKPPVHRTNSKGLMVPPLPQKPPVDHNFNHINGDDGKLILLVYLVF